MLPLLAAGAALQLFGGFAQAQNLRRQTQLRLEQMRKQREQALSEVTARVGASGVEIDSGTVQKHLATMGAEWDNRISATTQAGNEAAGMSILSAAGSAFGSVAKGLGSAGSELQNSSDAWTDYQNKQALPGFQTPMLDGNPGVKVPDFDWIR